MNAIKQYIKAKSEIIFLAFSIFAVIAYSNQVLFSFFEIKEFAVPQTIKMTIFSFLVLALVFKGSDYAKLFFSSVADETRILKSKNNPLNRFTSTKLLPIFSTTAFIASYIFMYPFLFILDVKISSVFGIILLVGFMIWFTVYFFRNLREGDKNIAQFYEE